MRGARSIYVDYVDYDEIAHHAGATRIESVAALAGLDQVLTVLERIERPGPRRYHFVALSDHGQCQGAPFAARYGTDLERPVPDPDPSTRRASRRRRGVGTGGLGAGGPRWLGESTYPRRSASRRVDGRCSRGGPSPMSPSSSCSEAETSGWSTSQYPSGSPSRTSTHAGRPRTRSGRTSGYRVRGRARARTVRSPSAQRAGTISRLASSKGRTRWPSSVRTPRRCC